MSKNQTCQICDREANFVCGDCKVAKYCTSQHRSEHWRLHKQPCKAIRKLVEKKLEDTVQKDREEIRKRYFEHFTHKIYDQCIIVAKQLYSLQKSHIELSKQIFNEFDFGISVCLLCRTFILVNRFHEAKQNIDNYVREKKHFLEDMRIIPSFKDNASNTKTAKQFLEKKLSLISAVANIYYSLKENCIEFYNIYTRHIEMVFGPESFQLSNVYFCVGCYYKEINQTSKAIACFIKCAQLRGKKGGDCYVNLSLLYRRGQKLDIALNMMMNAVRLNEEQYGPSSREVAEVYEKLGLLYLDVLDYDNSILNMENALKIYINQKESDEYKRVKEKINILYAEMKKYIEAESNHKKIKKEELNQDNKHIGEDKRNKRQDNNNKAVELDKIFKITETFMNKLNPMELFRLSNLQIQLQKCRTQFSIVYTIRYSQFYEKLSDNRKRELKADNEKLFQLINIEQKNQKEDSLDNLNQ